MKKFYALAIAIALLSFAGFAEAAVAVEEDGVYVGEAVKLDAGRALNTSFDGYDTVTFLANGHKDGVTTNVSQESNLTSAALAYGFIRKADTGPVPGSGYYAVSLANGVKGQMVTIQLVACTSGTFRITDDEVDPSTMTKTGWDDITFDTALDSITLLWLDDTYGWIIIGNNGCTIT